MNPNSTPKANITLAQNNDDSLFCEFICDSEITPEVKTENKKVLESLGNWFLSLQKSKDNLYKMERIPITVDDMSTDEAEVLMTAVHNSRFYESDLMVKRAEKIIEFYDDGPEIIQSHFPDIPLRYWVIPIEENNFTDHNRDTVNIDKNWNVVSIILARGEKVLLKKWYKEDKDILLKTELENIEATIDFLPKPIQKFICELENIPLYKKDDIEKIILREKSNFENSEERIEKIIRNKDLKKIEKIAALKEEYWTWGRSVSSEDPEITNSIGFEDHSPWIWITYKMDNGQVFLFKWSEVYDIYEKDIIGEEPVKEKKEITLFDASWKQVSIFDQASLIPSAQIETDVTPEVTIETSKAPEVKENESTPSVEEDIVEELEDIHYKDQVMLDIKKKIKFWMIKDASMWKFVLDAQIFPENFQDFERKALDRLRPIINENALMNASIPDLRVLYDVYDLDNIDEDQWDFHKIFSTASREYIKGSFTMRLDKIVRRMNEYDNPKQTLEEYFHNVRVRNWDLMNMDFDKYKRVVSAMTIIFTHDLKHSNASLYPEIISNINPFMRKAKKYMEKKGINMKELDACVHPDFIKRYSMALKV